VEIVYVPVLDPKIINNKTEGNLRRNMAKERGGGCLVVTVLGEMGHELLISMKSGLGKAWDSIDNLRIEKYLPVLSHWIKGVMPRSSKRAGL
jgi:hypothetical protein